MTTSGIARAVGLTILSWQLIGPAWGESDPVAAAKLFVKECLTNSQVFVYNPPADQNPYKDLTPEAKKQLMQRAGNGALLMLYLDGLPAKFESKQNYREHGLSKTWYSDGTVRSEELFDAGKLLTGRYLAREGTMLGEIKDGEGQRIIFPEPLAEPAGPIHSVAEYHAGLKNGVEVLYADYDKGIKSQEAHYKDGKLDGKRIAWMPSGQKNLEENFAGGVPQGETINWYPS